MGRSTKVACGCGSEMNVEKMGVVWLEQIAPGGDPYKLWSGDRLKCRQCSLEVILLADSPYMAEWDTHFYIELERLRTAGLLVELGCLDNRR